MAIGRPDWTSVTLIKALDAAENLVTVLADASRALVAVIQGDYLGELKTIATDHAGRMIAVTRRSLGGSGIDGAKNVTVDENIDPDRWYNYSSLTVAEGATLGLSAAGKMFLRVAGTVTIDGTISVKGKGSSGGAAVTPPADGNPGEADNKGGLCGGGGGGGNDWIVGDRTGGAGGASDDDGCGDGGAGAVGSSDYGSKGGAFDFDYDIRHDFDEDWDYFTLNRGPGGGSGGSGTDPPTLGVGGNGGGVLYLEAFKIIINGAVTADGDDGGDMKNVYDGAGGGGAGGTIVLIAREFEFNGTISADGGAGGKLVTDPFGGAGADGIIKTAVVY